MATASLPDNRKRVTEKVLDHEDGIYRHKKRPEWGVAILAWEKDERRAYQFEDGRLRKFKEGYYSLMVPADEEVERSKEAVVKSLEHAIEANRGKEPPKPLDPVASWQAQVDLFTDLYPGGFQDEEWIEDHRGEGPGRTLKRHREAAKLRCQEQLSKERCDRLIAEGEHGELAESLTELLASTSLVALKHVKPLRRLDDEERVELAETVRDLLHGDDAFEPRFQRWIDYLTGVYDSQPSWRIATAPLALMYPDEHTCVRRSAFIRQAAVIAPLVRYSKRAKVRPYKNFRRVAFGVRKKLEADGHEPRDLLDVYDFIWDTLRTAALDHLNDD